MQLHPHRQNNGVNNTTWAILVPLGSQHPDKNFMTGPPGCMWVYVIWHCVSWWHITSHSPIQFFKSLTFFFHVLSLDFDHSFLSHPSRRVYDWFPTSPPHPTFQDDLFLCTVVQQSPYLFLFSPSPQHTVCSNTSFKLHRPKVLGHC